MVSAPAGPAPIAPLRPVNERWNELDGYRGLLAVAIVVFHCDQESLVGAAKHVYDGFWIGDLLANLDSAVAAFLALSGFLLFLPFARTALSGEAPPPPRRFLGRRLARIIPAYWFAVVLVWASRYGGGSEQQLSLIEHLTFTQVFDSKHIFWDIGPTWFLADNVIYCFLVAAFGVACTRVCRRVSRTGVRLLVLLVATLCVAGVSIADKWWAYHIARIPSTAYSTYFGPLAKVDLFAFGMVLAVATAALGGRRPLGHVLRAMVMAAGSGVIAWAFVHRNAGEAPQLYFHTVCGVGFTLVLAGLVLSHPGGVVKRALSVRPLALLGVVSYSLFLWHEPVLVMVATQHRLLTFTDPATFGFSTAVLVALSVVVATIAYRIIEAPADRFLTSLGERTAIVRAPPASPQQVQLYSWPAFIELMSAACSRQGWRVDGGGLTQDSKLVIRRGSERRTLLCGLWWRTSVAHGEIQALVASIDQPTETAFVTGAELDHGAERAARSAGLHVIAGPALLAFVGDPGLRDPWLHRAEVKEGITGSATAGPTAEAPADSSMS